MNCLERQLAINTVFIPCLHFNVSQSQYTLGGQFVGMWVHLIFRNLVSMSCSCNNNSETMDTDNESSDLIKKIQQMKTVTGQKH